MNRKHLLVAFMALFVLVGIAAASIPTNASVSAGPQEKYAQPAGGAGSVVTEGGNVTEVNLTGTNSSTERWAGFYGNLTGSKLVLGDSTGNAFYAWSVGSPNALWKVYASGLQNPVWANLAVGDCPTSTNCNTWVYNGAWADNYTNTFTSTGGGTFAGIPLTSVPYVLTYQSGGSADWPTYHLQDSSGGTDDVWAANVSTTLTAFNSRAGVVYQLMVPADPDPSDTVTYYFYLEVN